MPRNSTSPDHEAPARRLLTGPPADLEPAFLAALRALRGTGSPLDPIAVLVPGNLLKIHLNARLAESGGAINVRFYLLADLARAIVAGGGTGRKEAPPFLDELVVEGLLDTPQAAAGPFAPIRDRPGLVTALLAAFADLAAARIAPADLKRALGRNPAPRLRETARLHAAFEAELQRLGVLTPGGLLLAAAAAAPASAYLAPLRALLVYGPGALGPAALALLDAVAGRVATTVFLPQLPGNPASAALEPLRLSLLQAGFREERAAPLPDPRPARLRGLGARLFRPPEGDALPPDGSLELLSCPGELREAWAIARALAARTRTDRELRFERVAVLARRVEALRPALAAELDEHGVPVATRRSLAECRPARTLLSLLAARRTRLRRQEVMALLDLSTAAPADLPRLDRVAREAGIVGGREEWERRLEGLARESDSAADAQAARELRRAVLGLDRKLARLPARARPSAFVAPLIALLEEHAEAGEERERSIDVVESLERLDAAGREVSLERVERILREALEAATLPPARDAQGRELRPLVRGALVADLAAAALVPFDVVVIAGLVEKSLPAPPREDPVLLDAEREAISAALGRPGALRTRASRREDERWLFAQAVAGARRALVLTWPRIDPGSGRERVASSFLLAVAEAVTGAPADYAAIDALDATRRVRLAELHPGEPAAAESELEFDLALAASDTPRRILHLAGRSPFFRRGLEADARRWSSELTEHDGLLGAGPLPERAVSPTRLETWARCPLQYFFKHELNLRPIEDPERVWSLDPLDRGSLVHGILFEFLSKLRDDTERLTPAHVALLREVAERELAKVEGSRPVGPPFLWAIERAGIVEDLLGWLDVELKEAGEVTPSYFEARFGPPREGEGAGRDREDPTSLAAPLEVELGDGRKFSFHGRIDRIDLLEGGRRFRVVDYKYKFRADPIKDGQLRHGQALQLPLYLLAARKLLASRGIEPESGEAFYWYVSRRAAYARARFSEEDWPAKHAKLLAVCRAIAAGLAAGHFAAVPGDHCGWCDFEAICGSARWRLDERKRDDPRRALHRALADLD